MTAMNLTAEINQSSNGWTDWTWQQKNAIRSVDQLLRIFPSIPQNIGAVIKRNHENRRLQITPYYLQLIRHTSDGLAPLADDPMWRQVVPYWETEGDTAYKYDSETENWEMPEEMVTPIAQHKYDNRIIIRLANVCHGYCQFCYEALRTLEKHSFKPNFQQKHWDATVNYLSRHAEVEEAILSGGEPLMHDDERLDHVLSDLRNLGRPIIIRIHTRALTFNPFRITDELVEILRHYKLNAIGFHVTHPNEITQEFRDAVERLWRKAAPIMFANIPLLHGINDTVETMHTLCMTLYSIGVIPHYLYHFMPYSPGATEFRTPVRVGVEITRFLKRRISNLAIPEFVLPHQSGKQTMPLLAENEPPPEWGSDANGNPIVRYVNWRGERVEYLDISEKK